MGLKDYNDYNDSYSYYNDNDIDYEYLEELKTIASSLGIDKEYIDILLDEDFTLEEIEEYIYSEWDYSCNKGVQYA